MEMVFKVAVAPVFIFVQLERGRAQLGGQLHRLVEAYTVLQPGDRWF